MIPVQITSPMCPLPLVVVVDLALQSFQSACLCLTIEHAQGHGRTRMMIIMMMGMMLADDLHWDRAGLAAGAELSSIETTL